LATPIILLGHSANYADILDTIEDINAAQGPQGPRYELLGFLDDREAQQGRSFHGYPVLGRYAAAPALAQQFPGAAFSTWIGGVETYLQRQKVIDGLGLPSERFATLVHPTAYVSRRARLGRGVVVYQHCTIANNAVLGDHVVVLPNTVISHDDIIGDYTAITGGVAIAGNVTVGPSCYLGTNCSIHPGVSIGEGSLVGMGSVVLHDVGPYQVVAGNPVRLLRDARR
jgi:sugar O-acyltransferase (sialic acid O-acetyltransferase NeuD family)